MFITLTNSKVTNEQARYKRLLKFLSIREGYPLIYAVSEKSG